MALPFPEASHGRRTQHRFLRRVSKRAGFTLIELLVVISIIAVLASIILAALSTARQKGNYASVEESLIQMRDTYELQYYANANSYSSLMPVGIVGSNTTVTTGDYYCNTTGSNNFCNVYDKVGCQTLYAGASSSAAICTDALTKDGSSGTFSFGVISGGISDYAFAITNPSNTASVFCIRSNGNNLATTTYTACFTKTGSNNW